MKCKAYIRVGKKATGLSPYKVVASEKPNEEPISEYGRVLPTAKFALEFDIPESHFKLAEQVLAQIKIAESTQFIPGEVTIVEVP